MCACVCVCLCLCRVCFFVSGVIVAVVTVVVGGGGVVGGVTVTVRLVCCSRERFERMSPEECDIAMQGTVRKENEKCDGGWKTVELRKVKR